MAPKEGRKRAIEDEIFSSKPTLVQQKFQPRLRAIKAMYATERPRKRSKNQTTMTQLDFGKRSYLEAICDSDDEDEEVKSEDRDPPSTARKGIGSRRKGLPEKTESQDTLTQFVKRASDVSMMVISDSEDEGEENVSDVEAEAGEEQAAANNSMDYEDVQAIFQQENQLHSDEAQAGGGVEAEPDSEAATDGSNVPSSSIAIAVESESTRPHPPPRTPRRIRVLPVPSSRSPPDTALSTQVTPRQARSPEQRSPLKEKSSNVRAAPTARWPLKEKSANIRAVPRAKSPLKSAPNLPPPKRSAQKKRKSPAQSAQKKRTSPVQKPARESPTRRRVRDFNARFAILEQENADLRSRRTKPMTRATVSAPPLQVPAHATIETQFSMPGAETQAAWLELPFGDAPPKSTPNAIRENNPEIVENSQPFEHGSARQETVKQQESIRIIDDTEDEDEGVVDDIEEAVEGILIPSSQSKNNAVSADQQASLNPASSPVMAVAGEDLLEESLPESTYNSPVPKSTARSRHTQDLASDQLLRETQQAFMFRVPSSPEIMPAPTSTARRTRFSRAKTQDDWQIRLSQATTVDESMSHSAHRSQRHMNTPELTSTPKPPPPFLSSSPNTEPLLETALIISSSPLLNDPILSSSSPRAQEPKTPNVLRNLRRPLRMEELMSDSLEASLPMPPDWSARLLNVGEESEDDDGEL